MSDKNTKTPKLNLSKKTMKNLKTDVKAGAQPVGYGTTRCVSCDAGWTC